MDLNKAIILINQVAAYNCKRKIYLLPIKNTDMKYLQKFGFICVVATVFFACKKSEDSPASISNTDWKEELKNTIWAGEYRYTIGQQQSLQPFSMKLNSDGTVLWEDLDNRRSAGNWSVTGDQIIFNLPNGTTLSATVNKDKWGNFKSGAGAGFIVENIARSVTPLASELANTIWTGTTGPAGRTFELKFLNNGNIVYTVSGSKYYSGPYTIGLAGIEFREETSFLGINFYGTFKNANVELTGLVHFRSSGADDFFLLNAKKQ